MEAWWVFAGGFVGGSLIALAGIYIYRKAASKGSKSPHREESYLLDVKAALLFENVLNKIPQLPRKYIFVILLLAWIILSLFLGNITIFNLEIQAGYLILFYAFISLITKVDSRVSIGTALFLLATCPFLLIYEYQALAENVAVYAYYFLVIGVIFQVIEYVRGARQVKEEMPTEAPEVFVDTIIASEEAALEKEEVFKGKEFIDGRTVSLAKRQADHWRKRKIRRRRKALVITFVLVGLFVGSIFLWSTLQPLRTEKFSSTSNEGPQKVSKKKVAYEENAEKKAENKAESEAKSVAGSPIEKSQIGIEVLNGNGIQGEAVKIGTKLKELGFNVLKTGNADRTNYPQTVIRYKTGQKNVGELVAKEIADSYTPRFSDDLPSSYESDIVIILGRESVDKSKIRIQVLNGNGIRGEAARVSDELERSGFTMHPAKDADRNDYSASIIRHKPGQRHIAELVVSEISNSYPASLKEDLPSNSAADIVMILGKNKIR